MTLSEGGVKIPLARGVDWSLRSLCRGVDWSLRGRFRGVDWPLLRGILIFEGT